ncbi:transglycosylase SLT domain-containing protein [Arenibaculum pallidiluteum]|uniref:transglycosylase SLT domain-containing protein n=1 Tax=Arenibaculum pallidiluteum TaxID=2812559 RepID=UPI001A9607DC|nr:transglycosylase SLT domain-containing protein [Arenibaculum pallidiluteum]
MERIPLDPPIPGRKPTVPARKAEAAQGATGSKAATGEAIRLAAGAAGHSFSTLLAQATQESGLNPKARNPKSTATGAFQFVERTWLDMVRRHGAAHGLGELAAAITVKDGAPVVKDASLRSRILALREDPQLSASMAGRYLSESRAALSRRLGREVSETEGRIAYVLGPTGAAKLLQAAVRTPDRPAAEILPAAARANRPLFHDRGRVLGAAETVARLKQRMEADATRVADLVPAEPESAGDGAGPAGGNPLLLAQENGTALG